MSEKLVSAKWLTNHLEKNSKSYLESLDVASMILIIREAPAVDAVEVTYCDQCSNHGHCIPEDTFRLAGVEKPFCCVGGRRKL